MAGIWARGVRRDSRPAPHTRDCLPSNLAYLGYSKPSPPPSQPVFLYFAKLLGAQHGQGPQGARRIEPAERESRGTPQMGKTRTPMNHAVATLGRLGSLM